MPICNIATSVRTKRIRIRIFGCKTNTNVRIRFVLTSYRTIRMFAIGLFVSVSIFSYSYSFRFEYHIKYSYSFDFVLNSPIIIAKVNLLMIWLILCFKAKENMFWKSIFNFFTWEFHHSEKILLFTIIYLKATIAGWRAGAGGRAYFSNCTVWVPVQCSSTCTTT